jgi:hypothetical protein
VKTFFGDGERAFELPLPQLKELERLLGAGFGAIFNRVFQRNFGIRDVLETIRLGLIGGGASPQEAAELVVAYGNDRPLAEIYPIALAILEAVWFGDASLKEEQRADA